MDSDQYEELRMGQGNVGDGLDFGHLQNPQVGLPLVKPIKRIMVAANVFWHRAVLSNGSVAHPAECGLSDGSGLDAESNDPARVLIRDDQNPVGSQSCRFASEQIDTPEAVLHVALFGDPVWLCIAKTRKRGDGRQRTGDYLKKKCSVGSAFINQLGQARLEPDL